MSETQDYLLNVVLIPVFLLVLKSLLGEEIQYWLEFLHCLFVRPYDIDKNPDTHDWAMIYNPGNGEWSYCSLTFHFGWKKEKNGVFIYHYDTTWKLKFTQRLSFKEWRNTQKGKLNSANLPQELRRKINGNDAEEKTEFRRNYPTYNH